MFMHPPSQAPPDYGDVRFRLVARYPDAASAQSAILGHRKRLTDLRGLNRQLGSKAIDNAVGGGLGLSSWSSVCCCGVAVASWLVGRTVLGVGMVCSCLC